MCIQNQSVLWVKSEQMKLCKVVHSGFGRDNKMVATQHGALYRTQGKLSTHKQTHWIV